MTFEEIKGMLKDVTAEVPRDSSATFEDLGVDSMTLKHFLNKIKERLETKRDFSEINTKSRIQDLLDIINSKGGIN